MNRQETLMALRMVAAYQPGQKTDDEFTAEAWADAFTKHEFLDVRDAVKKLGIEPRRDGAPFYFELRDVLNEVNTVIGRRLDTRMSLGPPSELSAVDYRAWANADADQRRMRNWEPAREIEHPSRPIGSLIRQIGAIRHGAHPQEGQS